MKYKSCFVQKLKSSQNIVWYAAHNSQIYVLCTSGRSRSTGCWFKLNASKLCQPQTNAACNSHSNVIYIYYMVPCYSPWTVEEGDSHFSWSGCRTGASGENVPPPTTAVQNGQQWSGVSVGRHHVFSLLFFMEPVPGITRHAYKKFRANIRRPDRSGVSSASCCCNGSVG